MLGLVPSYGQTVDPYSEISFPMQYNPYLAKREAKRWRKQQKYLAKYGQFGLGPEFGMGYFNEMDEDEDEDENEVEGAHRDFSHTEFNNISDDGQSQSSNTLGLIHPAHEGKDTWHSVKPAEPEYVT